jgi:hypothetical protein
MPYKLRYSTNSVTSDILKAWFQKLEIPAIKAIKPENR